MIDYSALLFDPVYAEVGVPATMNGIAITVYDDTRRKSLPIMTQAGAAEVRSVGPGAFARVYELAAKGIDRDAWTGASVEFNGRSYVVRSYELHGSPNGEDLGEVRLALREVVQSEEVDGGGEVSSNSYAGRSVSAGAIA